MDTKSVLDLGVPLAFGLAALGSAVGLGRAVGSALEAIGRQPESFNKILIAMAVGCAFIDTITIFAMLIFFSYVKQ